jgi:broad specificity phosphatase PhoE
MAASVGAASSRLTSCDRALRLDDLASFPQKTPQVLDEIRERLRGPLSLPYPVHLALVRHGQTTHNRAGLVSGSLDVALTVEGRARARHLGHRLSSRYDLAVCSTLQRSWETLDLALQEARVPIGELFKDPRLSERSLGDLEGKPIRHVPAYRCGDLAYAPPGGDSYLRVTARSLSFLLDLRDWVLSTGAQEILVSTHMGPLRILIGVLRAMADPVTVLSQQFANTEVLGVTWSSLSWPTFLDGH